MADEYICKQDAVNMFNRAVQDVGILDADDIEIVFGMLSPADVVPVVRCQNCEEYKVNYHWCRLHETEMSLTDFLQLRRKEGLRA